MSRTKHKVFCYDCVAFLGLVEQHGGPVAAGQLPALRRDVGLLAQTWSVMAGRNLMNDVLRGLRKLEASLSGTLKPSCAGLRKRLEFILASHVVGKARYDTVVCLGYRVKTAFDGYKGKSDDYQDMKSRCDDLKAAIRAARGLVARTGKLATDSNVLKIFMAPEFYFRGRNGAYDFADVTGQMGRKKERGIEKVAAKSGIVEIMEEEMDDPIYKDWLFVLGTAIAATKITRTVCATQANHKLQFVVDKATGKSTPVCQTDHSHKIIEVTDGAQIDNIAFVWKEGQVHTVSKELVSHVDFVKNPNEKNVVTVRKEELSVLRHDIGGDSPYKTASSVPSKFQDERMGGSIFTIDGVTFGLEVCLDHAASTRSKSAGRLNHAGNIQVQLIPSAGMDINSLRTVAGGVVFNVDGTTPHVQAVGGGGPKQEVRYDFIGLKGKSYELSLPGGVSKTADLNMELLEKSRPLNTWDQVDALKAKPKAPLLAAGRGGSVLLYGPYELPNA
jgi:hypothetical protein